MSKKAKLPGSKNKRKEVLEFINKIIEEEHGNSLTEDNLLTYSEIDSFGYAMFWLSINQKYGIEEIKGIDNGIDYNTLLVSDVITYVITKDNKHIIKEDVLWGLLAIGIK